MEKVPMTAGGFAALDAELKQLKSVERPAVIRAISEARCHDLARELAEAITIHYSKGELTFVGLAVYYVSPVPAEFDAQ